MKQNFKGFITGLMTALFLFGSVSVMAAPSGVKQAIEVTYDDYKTFIMGTPYTARNALGEALEPFEYDGSIYLPMETIMAALRENGMYDPATKSIHIGIKQPTPTIVKLDDIQYTDFISASNWGKFYRINGTVTDFLANSYDNGIVLFLPHYTQYISDEPDNARVIMKYPLDKQYKTLKGKVVIPESISITGLNDKKANNSDYSASVLFYGDGKLLHTVNDVTSTMPLISLLMSQMLVS